MEGAVVRRGIRAQRRYAGARRQRLPARLLYLRLPFPAALGRWRHRPTRSPTRTPNGLRMRELVQQAPYALRLVQPRVGGLLRPVRPSLRDGDLDGLQVLLMADYQTLEHDVVVIGAGGAGLR